MQILKLNWFYDAEIELSYPDGNPSIMAYLAACSLMPQTALVTLDLQTNNLIPSQTQAGSQSWVLWSPEVEGSYHFTSDV